MTPKRLPSVVIQDFPHAMKMTIDGKVLHGVTGYSVDRDSDGRAQVTVTFEAENVNMAYGPDED